MKTWLVDTLAGSWLIFILLSMIVIAMLAAKFRMSNITFFMFLALFAIMFGYWITWAYALAIMIIGMIIFYVIARLIKN